MASASMNDIKARIKSVSGTMQITKAMELVATSKLRRAKERAEAVRPYLSTVEEAMAKVLTAPDAKDAKLLLPREENRVLLLVIAGDRGLAGGFNNNIFRLCATRFRGRALTVLPIGHRTAEYFKHRETPIFDDRFVTAADLGVGDCFKIAEEAEDAYLEGKFDAVYLVYTEFASMMSQIPRVKKLLPLTPSAEKSADEPMWESEDFDTLLSRITANYIGGVLAAALAESLASESGARRAAMNAANKNAEEMLDGLTLHYNQARQAVITQEITEIVSGAEAL